MSEINDPLGRSSFSHGSRRVMTVDDPSQEQAHPSYQSQAVPSPSQMQQQPHYLSPEERQELQQRRQQANKQVSSTVRQRIEYLSGIGRIRDEFEMEGPDGVNVKFHLQSLKSRELDDVHDFMVSLGKEITTTKFNFEVRKQILARSLWAVDEISIENVIGSDTMEDRLYFIDSLDENLVSYMFEFYEKNIMRKGKKFAVKDEEDAKEVHEDIKKS